MEFLFVLIAIGITIFAILKRKNNPRLAGSILLALGLISLIIYFKFEGLVMDNYSSYDDNTLLRFNREAAIRTIKGRQWTIDFFKPIILIYTLFLFIIGSYFFTKKNRKN